MLSFLVWRILCLAEPGYHALTPPLPTKTLRLPERLIFTKNKKSDIFSCFVQCGAKQKGLFKGE